MKALISAEDYTLAITEGKLFYLEFQVFDADAEACFLRILRRFLSHSDLLYSRDVLITIRIQASFLFPFLSLPLHLELGSD